MAGMHPYTPSLAQSLILSTSPDDEHKSSCLAESCRGKRKSSRCMNCYIDKADTSWTSNLHKLAKICWGDDVMKATDEMKDLMCARAIVAKSGLGNASIMAMFEQVKGKGVVIYSHMLHTKTETK